MLSIFALSNYPPHGTYSASKAAAFSLSQALRAELRPAGVRVINLFPGPIDDEWDQLEMPPKLSPAALARGRRRGAQGLGRGRLSGRRGAGLARAASRQSESARTRSSARAADESRQERGLEQKDVKQAWSKKSAAEPKAADALHALLHAVAIVAARASDIVDLTQTLSPDFPTIVLPPEMGQSRPFRMEEISRYDDRGPGWYWNNVSFGEHTGTHFDAPIHWISGRDRPNNSVDTLPVEHFIAPACVIDCSSEAKADADFLLTVGYLKAWEKRHGRVPAGAWVLMRTDWSKRTDPVAYQNLDDTGQHTPGPDPDCVRFLVNERDVLGFGTETIGTDAGPGGALHAALSLSLLHARRRQIRAAMPVQSRPLAGDRRAHRRRTAENPRRQRQSFARFRNCAETLSRVRPLRMLRTGSRRRI